jgi:hypothetical protein
MPVRSFLDVGSLQSRLKKTQHVTLSRAKGLYDGYAPSHRPDALRESNINWTLQKPCF